MPERDRSSMHIQAFEWDFQQTLAGQQLDRKGLVDLPQINVRDRAAGLHQQCADGLHGRDEKILRGKSGGCGGDDLHLRLKSVCFRILRGNCNQ